VVFRLIFILEKSASKNKRLLFMYETRTPSISFGCYQAWFMGAANKVPWVSGGIVA